jgi:hypothetical protein
MVQLIPTKKQGIGSQIIFLNDGQIQGDDDAQDPVTLADINDQTKRILPLYDSIEYLHASDEPDHLLEHFLSQKGSTSRD